MKYSLPVLFIVFASIKSFGTSITPADTISYWRVSIKDRLLSTGYVEYETEKIVLTKNNVHPGDTLTIQYFDDTPCIECPSTMSIKVAADKVIRKIKRERNTHTFKIAVETLQTLARNNNNPVLRFYFRKDVGYSEVLLFEVEIK